MNRPTPPPGCESVVEDLDRGVDPNDLAQDGFPVDENGNLVLLPYDSQPKGNAIEPNRPRTQEEKRVGLAGLAAARAALSRSDSKV